MWWCVLVSPAGAMTANEAVDAALGRSPVMEVAAARVAEADARVKEVRSKLLPSASLTGFGLFGPPIEAQIELPPEIIRKIGEAPPSVIMDSAQFIGVGSLPIILLVGFFSGAVSAQQAIRALEILHQERFVGATVGLSLAVELAPVFTALMITARAGSGMATELGSMRITEQIDALTTFAVNPVQYLVTPRVVARPTSLAPPRTLKPWKQAVIDMASPKITALIIPCR